VAFPNPVIAESVGVLDCPGKVHHRKQGKNKGLDEAGKKTQDHHGQRRKVQARQEEKNPQDQFLAEYVSEKDGSRG